jgi:hypothetical protein
MRSFSSRVPWAAVATALAVAAAGGACATVDEPAPTPLPFPTVKSAALVRWSERGAERPKDALDALAASLAERGIATRELDLGRGDGKERRDLERLFATVEARVESGAGVPGRGRSAQPLGDGAARTVRALGADALALHVRFDERLLRRRATTPLPPFGVPPSGLPHEQPISSYRPNAAIALVSRDGALVWFDWGPRDASRDPEGPVNAAEAVDAAARLLAGDPDEGT